MKQVRRRRRRSVTGGPGTSPSSSSRVEKGQGVQKTVICSEIETIADVHREVGDREPSFDLTNLPNNLFCLLG